MKADTDKRGMNWTDMDRYG